MLKSKFNLVNVNDDETEDDTSVKSVSVEKPEAVETPVIDKKRKLFKSEVSIRLSMLGKTASGDGYTYLKATCTGMGLTDITALASFKHLQYVDVSENKLTLDDLQVLSKIPFLLLIHADKNRLESAALKKMKYLQVIIMNHNKITSVHDVFQPELSTLEAGYNEIEKIYFENEMPKIRCLDFRYNLIKELKDIDFPNLDSLYLAGNRVKSLQGINKLGNLRILHLRNNPLGILEGFDENNKRLQYLNLRNCKVNTLGQVKKLKILPVLETLILRGCPLMGGTGIESQELNEELDDDPDLRVSILAALPKLKRLNKAMFSPDERAEAKDLIAQWIEEGDIDNEKLENEELLEFGEEEYR